MQLAVVQIDKFYDKAYAWILTAGPKVILGIIVLLLGLWFIKIFSRWLHSGLNKREIDPSLKPFFISLAITLLRITLILAVMQIIGIQMTMFAAIVASFGVAVGLALSGTLQNFASGVLILMLKPFRVGDNIIAQGQEGTVTSIQIFYTIVTSFDNRTVVIPNSKLSNEVIINISMKGSRRFDLEIKFNYGMDYEQIREITNKTIDQSEDILKNPKRRIGVSALEESGYKVSISIWLKSHGFYDSKLEFQEKLLKNLLNSGLQLPGVKV